MRLWTLVRKQVQYHAKHDTAYGLSATFTVLLFYLYTSLLLHPQFRPPAVSPAARLLMVLVEVLVAVFGAWFLYDAHRTFVHLRWREWAILQVLGIGPRRLAQWITWQVGWVGVLSLAVGIAIGMLVERLFIVSVSLVLGLQRPLLWVMSGGAVFLTVAFFMALWVLLYVWTRWELIRRPPMDRLHQREPLLVAIRFSPVKAGLYLFCLCSAYGLAVTVNIRNLFPVAALGLLFTVKGTYGLYRQIVPECLRWISRSRPVYQRPSFLLAFPGFRLQKREVTRLLTTVTMLLTTAWTAVGVTGLLDRKAEQLAMQEYPFHVQLLEETNGADHMQVLNAIRRHGFRVLRKIHQPALQVSISLPERSGKLQPVMAISRSGFRHWMQGRPSAALPPVQSGQGVLISLYEGGKPPYPRFDGTVKIGTQSVRLSIRGATGMKVLDRIPGIDWVLVVTDAQFQAWRQWSHLNDRVFIHAYRITSWQKSGPMLETLRHLLPEGKREYLTGTALGMATLDRIFSPLMFVAGWIGMMFFLAAGSMLSFRLFAERDESRRFVSLLRLWGYSPEDIRRWLLLPVRWWFFLPWAVSVVHAAFALQTAGNLVRSGADAYPFILFGICGVLYVLYYRWISRLYVRAVMEEEYSDIRLFTRN